MIVIFKRYRDKPEGIPLRWDLEIRCRLCGIIFGFRRGEIVDLRKAFLDPLNHGNFHAYFIRKIDSASFNF